ncbi:hypothetical protein HDU98_003164, partial [Podochytrium sp. JEL0797]
MQIPPIKTTVPEKGQFSAPEPYAYAPDDILAYAASDTIALSIASNYTLSSRLQHYNYEYNPNSSAQYGIDNSHFEIVPLKNDLSESSTALHFTLPETRSIPDPSCISPLSGQWIHTSLISTFLESQQKFLDIQRHTILDYVWKPDHCLLRDFTMVQARTSKHDSKIILSVDKDIYSTDKVVNQTDISTFLFQFIGGMGKNNSGSWRDFMVHGAKSRLNAYYKDKRHPQLVILNFGNWDTSGAEGPADWEKNANEVADVLN